MFFLRTRMTGGQKQKAKGTKHCIIAFATWNVHTVVENAGGDRRIGRSRAKPGPGPQVSDTSVDLHYMDRKLDFLVKELRRLGVVIAGIQETQWFGKDMWTVDGYTLLHSGRTLPDETDPRVRNEGVGILLGRHAIMAWKNAGETWEAVSSRVVTARLKVVGRGRAVNDLTIMNTWFKKPQVHLATWKHPATKQAHMTDFVLIRKGQRRPCRDVRVCGSGCCWSDYHLVRGKVQLQIPRKKKVDTHVPLAVHSLSSKDCREEFQQTLCKLLLQHPHCVNDQPEYNWERLKKCVVEAAEDYLGRAGKRQPDWFLDFTDTLMPLVATKRRAHCRFLRNHNTSVDEAKEAWVSRVTREAELERKNGKQRWTSIRKLQIAHVGIRPAQSTKLYKREGGVTSGPEEVKATWH